MSGDSKIWLILLAFAILMVAAVTCFGLLLLMRPLFARYALAQPNARSSHKIPTPQGAGIGVIAATIGTVAGVSFLLEDVGGHSLWLILAAAVFIGVVGAIDMSPIPVLPRLVLQSIGVAIVLAALPDGFRIVPALPSWVESTLLGVAALWFINLVNFMDGIDWMTVAETVPVTAGLVVLGSLDALSKSEIVLALALCGAVAGFAPFNRPVATFFLGDVGSLSIGLLLAWLLINLAGRGHIAAALLLPLYYAGDATLTLLRRLAAGEPVLQAHRSHFYQRAMDGGFTVYQIVGRVFAVNIALGLLALSTLFTEQRIMHLCALAAGCAIVAWLLRSFARGRR
jgi:UDP-N-acetylmuramyl pentapeptide phosphotransferase/UDP-N-acetylglucosamine-1-phosphate transferase